MDKNKRQRPVGVETWCARARVCARVRIRAFFARVNSGVRSRAALHLWLTRRCIVFCREEKNGLCSTAKRPAKLPPLPLSNDTLFPAWIMHADTGRNPTLFSHMDRKHEIVSRVTILLAFNASTVTDRIDASFLYLHGNFIVDGSMNVKKRRNKNKEEVSIPGMIVLRVFESWKIFVWNKDGKKLMKNSRWRILKIFLLLNVFERTITITTIW